MPKPSPVGPAPPQWGERRRLAWSKLSPAADPNSSAVNAEHWASVEDALERILSHPVFSSVLLEKPLAIMKAPANAGRPAESSVEGSHIAPFNAELYTDAMASRGLYTCGGNLLWSSVFYTPFPGVPINRQGARSSVTSDTCNKTSSAVTVPRVRARRRGQVQYLKNYYFSNPSSVDAFPGIVTVAVDDNFNPLRPEALGFLRAISPEEPRHALLFAIARDVENSAPEEVLFLWRRVLLSTVMEFKKMSSEASQASAAA